jgi:hypothetical protein
MSIKQIMDHLPTTGHIAQPSIDQDALIPTQNRPPSFPKFLFCAIRITSRPVKPVKPGKTLQIEQAGEIGR